MRLGTQTNISSTSMCSKADDYGGKCRGHAGDVSFYKLSATVEALHPLSVPEKTFQGRDWGTPF